MDIAAPNAPECTRHSTEPAMALTCKTMPVYPPLHFLQPRPTPVEPCKPRGDSHTRAACGKSRKDRAHSQPSSLTGGHQRIPCAAPAAALPIPPVIRAALMNTHIMANIAKPSAHHPILLGFMTRETMDSTRPMNAKPHDAQPQQAPPRKLHAAANAAKQSATIPITKDAFSDFDSCGAVGRFGGIDP